MVKNVHDSEDHCTQYTNLHLLQSLGETYKKGSVAGWSTSTGQHGEGLVTPRDRLENYSWDLVRVLGLDFWPLIGLNPRL